MSLGSGQSLGSCRVSAVRWQRRVAAWGVAGRVGGRLWSVTPLSLFLLVLRLQVPVSGFALGSEH